MQLHLSVSVVVLLSCARGYVAADAKGTFANGNCAWHEQHLIGFMRGFKISCNNPKKTCTYTGYPHNCEWFYHAKENQYAFYQCLAKDSLKNAENACAKPTIDCYKECGNTANFARQQRGNRISSNPVSSACSKKLHLLTSVAALALALFNREL